MTEEIDKILVPYTTMVFQKAREAGITYLLAQEIIACEHELVHFTSEQELTKIYVDVSDEVRQYLERVTTALKVSVDAVIFCSIAAQIKKEQRNASPIETTEPKD